jgi:N-ethylmaleimide reductase
MNMSVELHSISGHTVSPAHEPLFQPYDLNGVRLENRILMAPMTRARIIDPERKPSSLLESYYAQRASAGLIFSEGLWISPRSFGWAYTPGIYTKEQIGAWRKITDAVHARGGKIFAQLWHAGSVSHPDLFAGELPLAPSAKNPVQMSRTEQGRKPTVTPRAMTRDEIRQTVRDFANAARSAMDAGFDGVQLQASYLYLFNQFLSSVTNVREDEYGGPMHNRARFLFEVLDAVAERVDIRRVGVKLGPTSWESGLFYSTPETLPTYDYVIDRLNDYNLSHVLMMRLPAKESIISHLQGDELFRHYRKIYRGTLIANAGYDQAGANVVLADGHADLVAFGRKYIANPDLVQRFRCGYPLAEPDSSTFYEGGVRGFADYPCHS